MLINSQVFAPCRQSTLRTPSLRAAPSAFEATLDSFAEARSAVHEYAKYVSLMPTETPAFARCEMLPASQPMTTPFNLHAECDAEEPELFVVLDDELEEAQLREATMYNEQIGVLLGKPGEVGEFAQAIPRKGTHAAKLETRATVQLPVTSALELARSLHKSARCLEDRALVLGYAKAFLDARISKAKRIQTRTNQRRRDEVAALYATNARLLRQYLPERSSRADLHIGLAENPAAFHPAHELRQVAIHARRAITLLEKSRTAAAVPIWHCSQAHIAALLARAYWALADVTAHGPERLHALEKANAFAGTRQRALHDTSASALAIERERLGVKAYRPDNTNFHFPQLRPTEPAFNPGGNWRPMNPTFASTGAAVSGSP